MKSSKLSYFAIWYMGCDYKLHSFFQFYHHWKINWITIIMFMFFVVVNSSLVSFNFWLVYEKFYFRLTIQYFPHISWYCVIFAFCFWTGKKLQTSTTTANTSKYASWSVIVSHYTEWLNRYILTKIIYIENGQLEHCPRFLRIWGLPCQRPNNAKLLPI